MAEDEPLWRSRLRWRWRGALLWPVFVALTLLDAWLLGWLPIAGDGGTDLFPAALLAGVLNLIGVAIFAPLLAHVLRRRRPDLPKVVAQDWTGTAMVVLVTAILVVAGLVHRPALQEAEADMAHQLAVATEHIRAQAPREYRRGAIDTIRMEDELYRTCALRADGRRAWCVYVYTDQQPPAIEEDESREPNATLTRFAPATP
jgi:hypothetical protein